MDDARVGATMPRSSAGWVAEKRAGSSRTARFTGYSPLSRLIELEMLVAGITGKLSLWRALPEVARRARLDAERLKRLTERAEAQRKPVGDLRTRAARAALVG